MTLYPLNVVANTRLQKGSFKKIVYGKRSPVYFQVFHYR